MKWRYNMNNNFIRGLTKTLKGILLSVVLVVSTINVFFNGGVAYWNDMAFIVWALCIVSLSDYFDKK